MGDQENGYCTNLNLMCDGTNLGEEFMMGSSFQMGQGQGQNQSSPGSTQMPQPFNETRSTTKKARGENFSIDEDLLLVSAFLNISLDAMQDNEQKKQTYWSRVFMFFKKHKQDTKRNQNSLMHRWSTIQLSTNKFCSYLTQIEAKNQNELTEQEKILKAKEMYRDLNKTSFQFEHCWNELRFQPKWLLECSQKKNQQKRKKISVISSSPSTPDSINLGEDDDSHNSFVDLERPSDVMIENEQLYKRKAKGVVDECMSSPIKGLLHEMKEDERQMKAERMKMYERLYHQDQEKLAIEQERVRVERLKEEKNIMLMDTSVMPPMQAEYIRRLQTEIFEQGRKT